MEKTKMSKKQFVIYMTVAFGLAWILQMIASIFSNNGNQMIFTSILMIAMCMPFLGVLIARIPLKGMGWLPHLKGKIRYVFFALWMPAVLSIVGGVLFFVIFSDTFDSEFLTLRGLLEEAGDIFAFIGHNGAGKTTTLKCVAGIHDFEQGEIKINGLSMKEDPLACKRQFAYIPDNPDLFDYLTGIQYLNFVADVFGVLDKDRQIRIEKYANAFGIMESLGDLISSYSHGMKQKLAIISALVHKPKLLILDEPFVGLDPQAAVVLKKTMHELCEEGGAIFFSTHVLDVAEKLCNKVAIIKDGTLIKNGNMEDVVKDGISLEDIFMEVVCDE